MASPFLDRLDTLDKIKKHMPKFRAELDDAVTFKNIYRFTFDFSKEPQQKCIGKCYSHNPNSIQQKMLRADATGAATTASLLLLIVTVTGCADIEIAQVLIGLLLVDRHALASSFLEFLKQQDSYKGLNVDQWTSLLEFCKTIDVNFGNYDENGACTYPLLLFFPLHPLMFIALLPLRRAMRLGRVGDVGEGEEGGGGGSRLITQQATPPAPAPSFHSADPCTRALWPLLPICVNISSIPLLSSSSSKPPTAAPVSVLCCKNALTPPK
jgi:hypothetical protein